MEEQRREDQHRQAVEDAILRLRKAAEPIEQTAARDQLVELLLDWDARLERILPQSERRLNHAVRIDRKASA